MNHTSTVWRGDWGITPLNPPQLQVSKGSQGIHVLGTLQELSAALGLARSFLFMEDLEDLSALLRCVQRHLYIVKCDLASQSDDAVIAGKHVPRICVDMVNEVDAIVAELEHRLGVTPDCFILEAGSPAATMLFMANETARRAERLIVSLNDAQHPDRRLTGAQQYLNHLSYQLYLMARIANRALGIAEESITTDAATGGVSVSLHRAPQR